MTLSCYNISCDRGETRVFSGLGFCLQPGGFLLLKGANGSGKTSLMRILAGLADPAEGEVTWNGAPIAGNVDFKEELTYIGHRNAVKTECTVAENVSFWTEFYNTHSMRAPAMRYFDLEDKADVPCRQLSAGWQRRVALTRLLLSPTKLWLLDEPTNFLDHEAILLVSSLIETRVQHGGIVLAASHTLGSSFDAHVLRLEDFQHTREGGYPYETDMGRRLRGGAI